MNKNCKQHDSSKTTQTSDTFKLQRSLHITAWKTQESIWKDYIWYVNEDTDE